MTLLIIAFVLAPLEWFFELKKNKWGIYITKPLVMLLLIAWVWTEADVPTLMLGISSSSILWFVLGLVFCLGGDIFLMLPDSRFFLPGLISFLLGHLLYIIGFNHVIPPEGSIVAALMVAVVLIFVSGWVYARLARGMRESGNTRMRIPVLIYTIVIALMLYSASLSLFDENWNSLPAIIVSLGALLFMVSDIMNAWVRFVGPIKDHRLWIMSTYHLAQFGIAFGATLHFVMVAG